MDATTPRVTVIMPTFNRLELLKESLTSILNQTYRDYELIIIDDCSTDGTQEYLKEMSGKDSRIVYVRNTKHRHYNYGLRLGCKLAKGEYLARMDDDDISLPERFEKQVKFLDENPDIAVVGTFFELMGNTPRANVWVDNSRPEYCALDAFYRCPLCHPTVMMRKTFLLDHHLGYDKNALYAEDTMLWIDIILAGGKIANIPEILLKYRVGHTRVSSAKDTSHAQDRTIQKARGKLWRLYFSKKLSKQLSRIQVYPALNPDDERLCNALIEVAERNLALFPRDVVYSYLSHFGVRTETMHICFAGNDKIAPQMCVAMTSIVRHKRSFDSINFFILENDMSSQNKGRIKRLETHSVSVEFIRVDEKDFIEKCPVCRLCPHVPVQTYFRYLIPQLKPQYEKVLYLDCDVVARKSLASLWGTDLGDNYAAVVQEFYFDAANAMKLKVPRVFNAGMLLLHNKKLVEENITEKLFENTQRFRDNIVYVDQDILNYTFRGRVVWVAPQYNAQINLWQSETCVESMYDGESLRQARNDPALVHYNSPDKPWIRKGWRILQTFQPFAGEYFKNLKHTPYRWRYFQYRLYKLEQFLYKRTVMLDYVKTRILCVKFKRKRSLKPSLFMRKIGDANHRIDQLESKISNDARRTWEEERKYYQERFRRLEDKIEYLVGLLGNADAAAIDVDLATDNFHPVKVDDSLLIEKLRGMGFFTFIPHAVGMDGMLVAAAEFLFFRKYDIPYARFTDWDSVDTIVCGGGGYEHENTWEMDFPYFKHAKKVLILPSSFRDCPRFVEQLDDRFTVFCRDARSYEYLRSANSGAEVLLDHDMVFRTDSSIFHLRNVHFSNNIRQIIARLYSAHKQGNPVGRFLLNDGENMYSRYILNMDISENLARQCAAVMFSAVDSTDAVVTDCLHVGLAAVLMGKEVYLIDDDHEEIASVVAHSLPAHPLIRFVDAPPAHLTPKHTADGNNLSHLFHITQQTRQS